MTMISKTTIGIAAGICGTIFLGYCFYFDRCRRNDPNFKKKLRERRRNLKANLKNTSSKLPNMNDHEAVQRFFIQEVQLGEELLGQGDVEGGVEHLANAVSVCGQPQQLLQVLQQTLPPQVFYLLMQQLPAVMNKGLSGATVTVSEDDVE
ncbi:mitochondrial import receptor subunit TOM20 homolog [Neocloeon triangulifer]|uniref:mitochondrial import receptor subunit TOM20 homolog n=1 Tax=Neocloeon triangulifer TaxID=2078957 RepID=UPI00286F2F44|nr:mitochondrial import receptor subunit TOM20 homolog [Neocloeon triangulifer]